MVIDYAILCARLNIMSVRERKEQALLGVVLERFNKGVGTSAEH